MKISVKNSSLKLPFLAVLIFFLGIVSVFPLLQKIPSHPDEYQFYMNAFTIMGGKELFTYIHVATTEYLLVGFFYLINLFTSTGVNFPQGDPSLVTHYFGKIFSLCLYALTFIVASIILQRNESKIKGRTVIFSALYFSSIGLMERFLRVNSDAVGIFVFLNYFILSFWLHRQKASLNKFFLLNLVFIFVTSFTNIKSLYLILPLSLINVFIPYVWYSHDAKDKLRLPRMYSFILNGAGLFLGSVVLWTVFMPRPFNSKTFWYAIKNTIVYGTKFDFNYPSQAFGSWKVYLYDLLMEQMGLSVVLTVVVILVLAYLLVKKHTGKNFFNDVFKGIRSQISLYFLKNGNLDKMTEIILLLCLLSYYFGVSLAVIHWSRWGAPIGLITLMLLSTVLEKAFKPIFSFWKKSKASLYFLLVFLFVFSWSLRIFLSIDLYNSTFFGPKPFSNTEKNVEKFLSKNDISLENAQQEIKWLAVPYSYNVGTLTWEMFTDPNQADRGKVRYVFWPSWNIGLVFTRKNVDKSTHNQRAILESFMDSVEYRFPSITSRYIHYTKLLAWKYLGLTWTPEVENMVEAEYAAIKVKPSTFNVFNVSYSIPFKDLSHYYSAYSLIFNIKNLPDSYMFPPCAAYSEVRSVSTGLIAETPPELGVGGKTAGLYCHNTWFRMYFPGTYRIKFEGLPDDPDGVQKVFSNVPFDWLPEGKTMIVNATNIGITISFGVATKEKFPKKVRLIVEYTSY